MRILRYRHWGTELALVGDWPQDQAEARLLELHGRLWSDSPPGLREDADAGEREELMSLAHPLGQVLNLLYYLSRQQAGDGMGDAVSAEAGARLRQVALRVLGQPAIAQVSADAVAPLLAKQELSASDGSYVRQMALLALRELAQPEDFDALVARLTPADDAALDEERAVALGALAALMAREPARLAANGLVDRLLSLAQSDRSAMVRVEAVHALMSLSPTEPVCAALRDVLTQVQGAPGEPEWAMAIRLFQREPATHAGLLLELHRRSEPPAEFLPLYTRLVLLAEDATLRLFLGRGGEASPLIFYDADGSVFALCDFQGKAPAGATNPSLPELAARWVSAADEARTALLLQLVASGHVAGRALAILAGPVQEEEGSDPDDESEYDADTDTRAAAPAVDWLTLARQVLHDPPLIRLHASDLTNLADQLKAETSIPQVLSKIGEHGCNHQMALKTLAAISAPGPDDAWLMVRCYQQAVHSLNASTASRDPVIAEALAALYGHSRRYGEPPPGQQILDAVSALARDGEGDTRRRAVQLLGRWPAAQTAALLQSLSGDPTYAVCCVADRALVEQSSLPVGSAVL